MGLAAILLGADGALPKTSKRKLPEFMFSKHQPDVIGRVVTEIAGAAFVNRLAAAAAKKRAASGEADSTGGATLSALDVNDLLTPQPKKKRRATPKAKSRAAAAATSALQAEQDASTLQDDVAMVMGPEDGEPDEDAPSRKRWWIDDVFTCLAHAAGGGMHN